MDNVIIISCAPKKQVGKRSLLVAEHDNHAFVGYTALVKDSVKRPSCKWIQKSCWPSIWKVRRNWDCTGKVVALVSPGVYVESEGTRFCWFCSNKYEQ